MSQGHLRCSGYQECTYSRSFTYNHVTISTTVSYYTTTMPNLPEVRSE